MGKADRAFSAPAYTARACEVCGATFKPYAQDMRRCEACRSALDVDRRCALEGCTRGVMSFQHKYCSDECATAARRAQARARYAKVGESILAAGIKCHDCGEQLRGKKGAASGRCRICWWKATQRKTVDLRKGRPTQSRFTITCQLCGAKAEKGQPYAKYCTPECRAKAGWKQTKAKAMRELIAALA